MTGTPREEVLRSAEAWLIGQCPDIEQTSLHNVAIIIANLVLSLRVRSRTEAA